MKKHKIFILIVNDKDEVLLLSRSAEHTTLNAYELPDGNRKKGEDELEIVNQELAKVVRQVGSKFEKFLSIESKNLEENFYILRVQGNLNAELSKGSLPDKAAWLSTNKIQQANIRDSHRYAILEYYNRGKNTMIDDKKTTEYDIVHIFTDGGSRGNPGPSASGYVIMTTDEEIIEEGGEYLGITTNNQAEYQAVKLGLQNAVKFKPSTIHFFIDSELVVKQMNGEYKIRNRDLWPIHSDIKKLAQQFKKVDFTHVRREFNKLADAQVNKILDDQAD